MKFDTYQTDGFYDEMFEQRRAARGRGPNCWPSA